MIHTITCLVCDAPISTLGKVAVTVNYESYERCCKSCNNMTDLSTSNHFCSIKCFEDYYIHDTQRAPKRPLTGF